MPDTTVKYFNSTMSGAPVLSGTAGALIGVLDACLVNGFGSVTLDSLVVASNVATGTISTGHNFAMVGTTGPVIKIEGATPSGLNGEWRLASVPTANTFTFATTGISDQTATGTITAKRAPAGFSKAFSGTNKAAYRSDSVEGTRLYLRVDHTNTTSARVRGYETMSDVETGTGPFPTEAQLAGGAYCHTSTAASSASRPWVLMADGLLFHLLVDYSANDNWYQGLIFGDLKAYAASDVYGCTLVASNAAASGGYNPQVLGSAGVGLEWGPRILTGTGTATPQARYSHGKSNSMGNSYQSYPVAADSGLHLWPVEVWDGTANARGFLPGLWNPLVNNDIAHGTLVESISGLEGRTVFVSKSNATFRIAYDLTGPWR